MNVKKGLCVLFFFNIVQFVFSACKICECPPATINEVYFQGFKTLFIEKETFKPFAQKVLDQSNIGYFRLRIDMEAVTKEMIAKMCNFSNSNFGYNQVLACECGESGAMINKSPITQVVISSIDISNNVEKEVTDLFTSKNSSGNDVQADKLFPGSVKFEQWIFDFKLESLSGFPNSTRFKIDVLLSSGVLFTQYSEAINIKSD